MRFCAEEAEVSPLSAMPRRKGRTDSRARTIMPRRSVRRSQKTRGMLRRMLLPKYSLYMKGLISSPTRPGLMAML